MQTHITASMILYLRDRCAPDLRGKIAASLKRHKDFYMEHMVGLHDIIAEQRGTTIGANWKAVEAKAYEAKEIVFDLWLNRTLPDYQYVMDILGERTDWYFVVNVADAFEDLELEDRDRLKAATRELAVGADERIQSEAEYLLQVFGNRERCEAEIAAL